MIKNIDIEDLKDKKIERISKEEKIEVDDNTYALILVLKEILDYLERKHGHNVR